jgi:hypothetical protein
MKHARVASSFLVLAIAYGHVFAAPSVYELTLKSRACEDRSRQSLECNYRVGRSLRVSIAGIGQPDTGIAFLKSDFDGDFYAKFGLDHGCVMVVRGKKGASPEKPFDDFAFISPKNGKVYANWQECKGGY